MARHGKELTTEQKEMLLSLSHQGFSSYTMQEFTELDDKSEEEKVNVYKIKFQSIYREANSKDIALSVLFFIMMLTAYKGEEIKEIYRGWPGMSSQNGDLALIDIVLYVHMWY
jgi:hypothetical protein